MSNQQLIDRFTTTLASSYTAGGVSLVLTSVVGLPTVGNYHLIVQAEGAHTEEVFSVTSRSGSTLTVVGAKWGTSASNHASSAVVIAQIFGSDFFKGITQDILMRGTRASLPATGPPVSRAVYKCTDSPYEFFWDGAAWQSSFMGIPMKEPLLASFSAVNSPTTSATGGGIYLVSPAHSGPSWRMMAMAIPARPYTIIAAFFPTIIYSENFHVAGLGWRQSSNGKLITMGKNDSHILSVDKWTDPNTYDSTYNTFAAEEYNPLHMFRISDDNVNLKCDFSFDLGRSWFNINTSPRTDFLTPNQIIFGADSESPGNDTGMWLVGWNQT